jgi:hypothetical protein
MPMMLVLRPAGKARRLLAACETGNPSRRSASLVVEDTVPGGASHDDERSADALARPPDRDAGQPIGTGGRWKIST